jgi:aldehyde dehydrogenase (NAD+)
MTTTLNCPTQILINNQWRDAVSGKTFATRNPATEEILCHVAEGDAADIDLAVKAAREAFDHGSWRTMSPTQRANILFKYAVMINFSCSSTSFFVLAFYFIF